ncbi:MAG TPA: HAMP domain-containing sensor histidine kinase [Solirubrobacteraceae bacterium]|jgi:two-component system sensor histidine kinase MprB|nr:HAMP domain-containing sensor histidine kinase [Solirubrobacteraceae bacterium]
MSLRARIGAAAGLAVGIAVVAVAVSAYAGTRSNLLGQIDQSLRNLANQVQGIGAGGQGPGSNGQGHGPAPPGGQSFSPGQGAAGHGSTGSAGSSPLFAPTGSGDCDHGFGLDRRSGSLGGPTGFFELVTRQGHTCLASQESKSIPVDARARAIAASGHGQYFTDAQLGSTHLRVLVTGVGSQGALEVALPLTDVDSSLHSLLLLLLVIGAAGIVLAAGLGILVARTALTPIARFTRRTEAVATGADPSQRLEVVGRDELARLAGTFNTTLDALERSVESQRNLVADASHELRTPIATLRANLQLLRDEARLAPADRDALREDMISELDELTGLVGDVVELARGRQPTAELHDVRVDLVAADLIERTGRRAPGLTFNSTLEPTLVSGEADRIGRAIINLLDNARKWSPPDGVVDVALSAGTLTVRDHGPGFPEEDLAFVFDRFHRAKDARGKPGSGLGLAIVRQAAEAHGGFAEAANAPGGGAVLRVSFGAVLALADEPESEPAGPFVSRPPR